MLGTKRERIPGGRGSVSKTAGCIDLSMAVLLRDVAAVFVL
jgi:hypothetical protein